MAWFFPGERYNKKHQREAESFGQAHAEEATRLAGRAALAPAAPAARLRERGLPPSPAVARGAAKVPAASGQGAASATGSAPPHAPPSCARTAMRAPWEDEGPASAAMAAACRAAAAAAAVAIAAGVGAEPFFPLAPVVVHGDLQ